MALATQPAQPQDCGAATPRSNALGVHPHLRGMAAGWLLLALTALALSTLCAVLLIVARTPLFGMVATSGELFGRALVLHVSLAVVVWFLACATGLWTLAAGVAASPVGWAALALAACGLVAMMVSLFLGAAPPVLANYVPVLNHPAFLAGLVLFIIAVALCGSVSLQGMTRRLKDGPVWRLGALLSLLVAVVALGAWITSLAMAQLPASQAGFEVLAWGPGHVLQFVHVILLMSVWTVLGEHVLGQAVAPRRWLAGLLLLAAAPVLAVPFIYLNYPIDSPDFRRAFTLLMALGCWPAPTLLALRLLLQLKRAGRSVWTVLQAPALLLSTLLFLLGCVLGAMIRNDSTMVPAHYHGTVGAVTLAYMALGYQLLPAFGLAVNQGRLVRWQPVLYGSGLMILALALAWSGWLGVPRKTLHVDVIVQFPAYFAAMSLAGLGGLLAISGAALFVFNILRNLRAERLDVTQRPGRRDVRWPAIALTAGLTVAIGMLLAFWPTNNDSVVVEQRTDLRQSAVDQNTQKSRDEIDRRFSQGVSLLNARQYEAAASELHQVLELSPKMPEAHVNMGFAMLGLKRYEMAKISFENATDLRRDQRNAYFGLAVALEGLRDFPGALGAMRSYVHLSKADDPYLRKANAAIWEWEEELKKTSSQSTSITGNELPVGEKKLSSAPIFEKNRLNTPSGK
ncbi:MAG: cbb3-type cytochrome c oxidase subunit I [Polaromonas sp.]